MEYIRNIWGIYHKYLWYKIIRNTGAAFGGAPMGRPPSAAAPLGLCSLFLLIYLFILWIFMDIPYIFLIYSIYIYIYIYFLDMFHVFSLVCLLIYGVKSRSGHNRRQSFGSISHASGPKLTFWCNFIMILHGFASRSPKTYFSIKNLKIRPKT